MRKRTESREIALKILYAWEITKETVEESRTKYLDNNLVSDESIVEFADFIINGVVSNLDEINKTIAEYATNWKLDRMANIDRNILRIAAFELMFADEIPPKVSINEAIEMAKKYGDKDSSKFVNGILDRIKEVYEKGS